MAVNIFGVRIALEGADGTAQTFKSAGDNASRLKGQLLEVKAGWTGIVTAASAAMIAFQQVVLPLGRMLLKPIEMAMEADKNMSRLIKTIQATGAAVTETDKTLEQYISSVEVYTLQDEKMIAGVMATNLAYGMNVVQAKKAIEAGSALAKLNGTDLASANQLLLQSMNEQLRGIAKVVPEINNLTESQRRSGAGITLIIEKLGYLNEMTSTTPYLAYERAKIILEDFLRTLGRTILKGIDWEKVFSRVVDIVDRLTEAVEENDEVLGEFGEKTVNTLVSSINDLIEALDKIYPILQLVYWISSKIADIILILMNGFGMFGSAIATLTTGMIGLWGTTEKSWKMFQKFSDGLNNSISKLTGLKAAISEVRNEATKDIPEKGMPKVETRTKELTAMSPNAAAIEEKELNKKIDIVKRYNEKLKKEYEQRGFISKLFSSDKDKPKYLPMPTVTKRKSVIEQRKEETGFGQSKAGEIFSTKEMTADKQRRERIIQAIEAMNALEKANESQKETIKIKALDAVNRAEMEYRRLGIKYTDEFEMARTKIKMDAIKGLFDEEIAKARLLGQEQKVLTLEDRKERYEVLSIQFEESLKKRNLIKGDYEYAKQHGLKQYGEDIAFQAKREKIRVDGEKEILDKIDDMQELSYSKQVRQYEQHLEELSALYQSGKINEEQYVYATKGVDKKKVEMDRAAGAPIYKTIDPKITDKKIDEYNKISMDTSNIIAAAEGGLSSLITNIGAVFGPPGVLIAQIINLITMLPEHFTAIIDGIMEALIKWLPNAFENIGILFERVLIALPDVFNSVMTTLLDIHTWIRLISAIGTAVIDMVKGVIMFAFTGKSLRNERAEKEAKEAREKAPKKEAVKFGSDTGNEGETKFKIKDVKATKAGSIADVMDNLEDTSDKASDGWLQNVLNAIFAIGNTIGQWWDKSFGQLSTNGFWSMLEKWWAETFGKLSVDMFSSIGATMQMWWDKSFGLLFNDNLYTKLQAGGQELWNDTFGRLDMEIFGSWKEKLGSIFTPPEASLGISVDSLSIIQDVVAGFKSFINNPMKVLTDISNKLKNFISNTFPFLKPISNALSSFGKNAFSALTSIAGKFGNFLLDTFPGLREIVDGFKSFASNPMAFLKDIADKFISFNLSAFDTLKGIADQFISFNSSDFEILKGIADQFVDGFLNAGTSIWEGFVSFNEQYAAFFIGMGTKIYDGIILFTEKFVSFFTGLGNSIFNGFVDAVNRVSTFFSDLGAKIWDGLKAVFAWPSLPTFTWPSFPSFKWPSFTWPKLPTFKWPELPKLKVEMPGGGGGGGTANQIVDTISGWLGSKGGYLTSDMKGSSLVPLFSAMGAIRAADGIRSLPGAGISDTIPVLARAGERILTPQQARAMDAGAGASINITINVAAGAKTPDKAEIREMGEKIIEYLKRESKNGRNVLRPSGVY